MVSAVLLIRATKQEKRPPSQNPLSQRRKGRKVKPCKAFNPYVQDVFHKNLTSFASFAPLREWVLRRRSLLLFSSPYQKYCRNHNRKVSPKARKVKPCIQM